MTILKHMNYHKMNAHQNIIYELLHGFNEMVQIDFIDISILVS